MSKVLVTLDFDGVVSPIDHSRDFQGEEEYEFEVYNFGFLCAVSTEVREFLQELKELSEAHPDQIVVRWASSWNEMTERFEAKSGGAIPGFSYIDTSKSKAKAIAAEALAVDASVVLVFEDSEIVHEELQELWKSKSKLSNRFFLPIMPELKSGILYSHILAAKSVIAFEFGKNS